MPKAATRARTKSQIHSVAIYPPIGVARIGDSPDDFFYGPEFAPASEAPSAYRDAQGRIKRQAARFRLYGFYADGLCAGEITSAQGAIKWDVHLANKKAAWFEFSGTQDALTAFHGKAPKEPLSPRNDDAKKFGSIELSKGKYQSDSKRKKTLEIDGGQKSISGNSMGLDSSHDASDFQFVGKFKAGVDGYAGKDVYLGEIRTDEAGRLIVLGGRGVSEPVDGTVPSDRFEEARSKIKHWITNYANNDHWHDDTSDGPITASVTLKDGRTLVAKAGAWVITTPPDFAPDVMSLVTLYDVMEEVALGAKLSREPGAAPIAPPDRFDFARDIKPIFDRVNDYRWVSPLGARGHGQGKPGVIDDDMFKKFADTQEGGRQARQRFLSVLRRPIYEGIDPMSGERVRNQSEKQWAIEQAKFMFMPPLNGDEGDRTVGDPNTWLTLTRLQFARLTHWCAVGPQSVARPPVAEPELLTRNALEACSGGAFYPGIEMTSIAREPGLYSAAFRLDATRLEAGDITKYMACPWQADFYECRDAWWPAQRPDTVVAESDFETVRASFELERKDNLEAVLFDRVRWDRRLDRRPWPDTEYVQSLLAVEEGERAKEYVDRIAGLAVKQFVNDPSTEDASRMPSPWRVQYLVQERLDGFAGRYFLPVAPSPEMIFAGGGDRAAKTVQIKGHAHALPNLQDMRITWSAMRLNQPDAVAAVIEAYLAAITTHVTDYVSEVIRSAVQTAGPQGHDPSAQDIAKAFLASGDDPQDFPDDFASDSPSCLTLRAGEFKSALSNALFVEACDTQGDMAMVEDWRNLGFVRARTIAAGDGVDAPKQIVKIETERNGPDSESYRDYFYKLMNVDDFPAYFAFSRTITDDILDRAERLIEFKAEYDPGHPESFIAYSPENFKAKLEQIYEVQRHEAAAPQQYVYKNTRADRIKRMLANTPFNQVDGAWLRFAGDAGPMPEVTSLLFEVWSDEVGNGDPALHHGNLYTALMRDLGFTLPEVGSREYADSTLFNEADFVSPVFELAISLHSKEYFPELLGMTLFLEWEVLSLVPVIKRQEYFGIDPKFWRMHVGIDNASHGHGAKARDAVIAYLDRVLQESGPDAQQAHWKRVWRGFVAFAVAGYDLFQSFDRKGADALLLTDAQERMPRTPADQLVALIQRKLEFGSLNHLRKQLGGHHINDLFDAPTVFLEELAASPWVAPGDPDASRILTYLTTFDGPMYKVFNPSDLGLWRNWLEWLGREGDTTRPKRFIDRAEAMMLLLAELRGQMLGAHGHQIYRIRTHGPGGGTSTSLAAMFRDHDPIGIMRALKNADNGYVVPYRPAESALIVDLLRPGRPMGSHLDRLFPTLQGQIGRMVVYEWIQAGCPIPGEAKPAKGQTIVTHRREPMLLVQEHGMGAVH